MESLKNHDYSGTDDGTEVSHFFQGIRNTELEAAVMLSKPNHRIMTIILMPWCLLLVELHSICVAMMRSQLSKPELMLFSGKIEYKNYPKTVWNSCPENSRCR